MPRNPKKKKARNKAKGNSSSAGPAALEQQPTKVWQPGVDGMDDDEQLEFDPSAYDCLHGFHLGWPCLSFDFLRDELGLVRNEFPHSLFCVAGTQAGDAPKNSVVVARLSNITGTRRKHAPDDDAEEDDSDSSSDGEDEERGSVSNAKGPTLQMRMVSHQGGVNRVRAMQQQPHIVATWGDNGYVQVTRTRVLPWIGAL